MLIVSARTMKPNDPTRTTWRKIMAVLDCANTKGTEKTPREIKNMLAVMLVFLSLLLLVMVTVLHVLMVIVMARLVLVVRLVLLFLSTWDNILATWFKRDHQDTLGLRLGGHVGLNLDLDVTLWFLGRVLSSSNSSSSNSSSNLLARF